MVNSITKDELAVMPRETFEGRIIVVQSEQEAIKAISYLSTFKAIGFDTETRPAFKKGVSHQVALMQLSTEDTCFLFRLNIIGFPDCLAEILVNPAIKKIGLSLKDDFSAMHKRSLLVPSNFIDLQSFVKKKEYRKDNACRTGKPILSLMLRRCMRLSMHGHVLEYLMN